MYQYEHMLSVRSSFPFRTQQLVMMYLISVYNSTNKVNCRCQREANGALPKHSANMQSPGPKIMKLS